MAVDDCVAILPDGSRGHGHVEAVLRTMRQLDFDSLLGTHRSRERDLVVAMVAARILEPQSKLATSRWWHTTTLPERAGVSGATEDDVYAAMDWVRARQARIEQKLAARHLAADGLALYDLTSSYFEGVTCPLAARGHDRDGKKGTLQVYYGLLTTRHGIPVAVSVFAGNTGDPTTLWPQVAKVRHEFGIERVVLVGDWGMITQQHIETLRDLEGIDWIGALRPGAIRTLVEAGAVQMGLFDERPLFELTHPALPGERLVACRNPALATSRAHTRAALLEATAAELAKVRGHGRPRAAHGRLHGQDAIGLRVGQVINKYTVGKHFTLDIRDNAFAFALDGLYVIRTSLAPERMPAEEAVRSYTLLTTVERAFRAFKTLDLKVRPIRHWRETRVRAHIFLCMLAYYVEWHMIEAWRPLLFCDEDQAAKATRDPVAPAQRSEAAQRKAHTKQLDDGSVVHSFQTLLQHLATIVRNTWRRKGAGADEVTFDLTPPPNPTQQRAYDLLKGITV